MTREVHVFESIKVADLGDCSVVPVSQEKTYKKIEDHFSKICKKNKKFISVGGDHSTTLPVLRALAKSHKEKINLIHFDAHFDTFPAAWDCEYHHGTFVRHAVEEGLIDPKKSVQIGIRGPLAASDDVSFSKKNKIAVCTVDDIKKEGVHSFIKTLPKFEKGPTYISFDIDCLDPAYAPGTGTPVPGGLTTYEAQTILRALNIKNLVGADVVEVCPAYDHSDITSLAAVDVIFELLCLFASQKK
jgi:agmatinase/guanidinopropionase